MWRSPASSSSSIRARRSAARLGAVSAKRGMFIAPFDELFEPRLLAELAARAEACGFDGFFLWDHVRYRAPTRLVADPWAALSAIACATERIRIGPLVTPLSRRRVEARPRDGHARSPQPRPPVLGVGLGSDNNGELEPFGEVVDPRERARLLDDGLERLTALWDGEFEPAPVQRPRIPVWVAARWPNRRPVRRAARWDGLFPIDQTVRRAAERCEGAGAARSGTPFEIAWRRSAPIRRPGGGARPPDRVKRGTRPRPRPSSGGRAPPGACSPGRTAGNSPDQTAPLTADFVGLGGLSPSPGAGAAGYALALAGPSLRL